MKKIWEVRYTHVVERQVSELVLAGSAKDAIDKCRNGDVLESDEDNCPENGIETKDYEAELAGPETQLAFEGVLSEANR